MMHINQVDCQFQLAYFLHTNKDLRCKEVAGSSWVDISLILKFKWFVKALSSLIQLEFYKYRIQFIRSPNYFDVGDYGQALLLRDKVCKREGICFFPLFVIVLLYINFRLIYYGIYHPLIGLISHHHM